MFTCRAGIVDNLLYDKVNHGSDMTERPLMGAPATGMIEGAAI